MKWIIEGPRIQVNFDLDDVLNVMVTLIKQQLFVHKLNNKITNVSSLKKKTIHYYEDERYSFYIWYI